MYNIKNIYWVDTVVFFSGLKMCFDMNVLSVKVLFIIQQRIVSENKNEKWKIEK